MYAYPEFRVYIITFDSQPVRLRCNEGLFIYYQEKGRFSITSVAKDKINFDQFIFMFPTFYAIVLKDH